MSKLRVAALAAALLLAGGIEGRAQAQPGQSWDPSRVQVTRQDLERLLAEYEQAASSEANSPAYRDQSRAEAERIRQRLKDGDVQAGDQIAVFVEGQAALSDTFTVRAGSLLFLPQIGDVPLSGLLRSEVEDRLREHLARYIRNPVVRARPLVRVAVEGQVGKPGYYVIPADAPVTDVVMTAGGPAPNTSMSRLRIERNGVPLWQGQALQEAIAQGRTIDAMGIHPGDRFYLPGRRADVGSTLLKVIPVAASVIFAVTRL